jgi:hypothetical protein
MPKFTNEERALLLGILLMSVPVIFTLCYAQQDELPHLQSKQCLTYNDPQGKFTLEYPFGWPAQHKQSQSDTDLTLTSILFGDPSIVKISYSPLSIDTKYPSLYHPNLMIYSVTNAATDLYYVYQVLSRNFTSTSPYIIDGHKTASAIARFVNYDDSSGKQLIVVSKIERQRKNKLLG